MSERSEHGVWELKKHPWKLSALTLILLAIYGFLRGYIHSGWLLPVLLLFGAYAINGRGMFLIRVDGRTAKAVFWAVALYIILLPAIGFVWWFLRTKILHDAGEWISLGKLPEVALWQLLGVAFAEEVYFRGVIQQAFDLCPGRKKNVFGTSCGVGVICASLVFGLAHVLVLHDPWGMLRIFPGLIFGYFFSREGGVVSAVLLHFLFNMSVTVWS